MPGLPHKFAIWLVTLGCLTAIPAYADSWHKLRAAVQRWRVGDLDGLPADLAEIQKTTKDDDVATVAAFVQARALTRLGRVAAAGEALKKARPIRDVLEHTYVWAEMELLHARGKLPETLDALHKLMKGYVGYRYAATQLLYSRLTEQAYPGARAAEVALALYDEQGNLILPKDELLARAARNTAVERPDEAVGLWRKLILKHPESAYVDEALKFVPEDALSDAEQFERMERLFARRAYERCREVGLRLWQKGMRKSEVGYYLGKIGTERLRDDYPGAAKYLEAAVVDGAPLAQQALTSYALVLTKLGRVDDGLAEFDKWFARYPNVTNEKRVDVAYDRARAMHVAGRSLEAAAYLQSALDVDRKGIDFGKYLWFVGYWQLRGGACDLAIQTLSPLLNDKNPLVGGKARYWMGKCLDKLGKRPEAVDMLVSVLDRHPLTWYSALAEDLLHDWGEGKHVPKHADLSKVGSRARDPFAHLHMTPDLKRLRMAANLGEPDTARWVLNALHPKLARTLGKAKLAELETDLADPLEEYAERRQDAMTDWQDVLKSLPTKETVDHWRAIYPRAYATHVVAAAKRSGAPEWMVYAHMLQESRYKPGLISGAPAYGLLELLDRTAARLATEGHDDYQLWMLMLPKYNIRWGAQYLGALYKKFGQQLPFAIASYNGGPMLMELMLRQGNDRHLALDELIDDIGPHESRNYVRMVVGHFLRYLAIYETPERAKHFRAQLLPHHWQATWLREPSY